MKFVRRKLFIQGSVGFWMRELFKMLFINFCMVRLANECSVQSVCWNGFIFKTNVQFLYRLSFDKTYFAN